MTQVEFGLDLGTEYANEIRLAYAGIECHEESETKQATA